MTDFASLVLAVDSTQVKTGVASLDGLTAAGARAEAATVGLGRGSKTAAAEGVAMATAAQASARAAMDQAAGFGVATSAARVNTLAMRESLVVARELARGNYTRIPGSLTLLAQGIGSQGGLSAFAQAIGLIKKVQDAELAEAATAAASAAAAVENAARRAASNVIAADTEIALAEAQVRVTAGTSAEAAAQVRLAEAHGAVAAAAAEAAVAEDALAMAMGRSSEASAAAAATARTTLGTTGAILITVAAAATTAVLGFEAIKQSVSDSGVLRDYAESLGLTSKKFDELKDKTNDFALTWGDVWHGVKKAAEDALDQSSAWQSFKSGNESAFKAALEHAVNFAAKSYGVVRGSYQTIVDDWSKFPAILGDAFYSAVNIAIGALNKLVKFGTDQLNGLIASVNKLPFVKLGSISAPQIGAVANPYAGSKIDSDLHGNISKYTAEGRARINAGLSTIYNDIIGAAEDRIKKAGGDSAKGKKPRTAREKQNPADDELAKLDAQIAGQNRLAKAYLTSDAAAIKAEADEKAMVLAVEKHATAAQTAALKSKELALAIADISVKGAKAVADLRFEADTRRLVNNEVAAGLIPASQANAALRLETQLRPLTAALSLADAAEKTRLLGTIRALTKAYEENNAQLSREQYLRETAANDNDIEKLRLEATLIGASNRQRAVALAQLEAMQKLRDLPGLSPAEQQNFIQQAITRAQLSVQTPFQQWAATIPQTADAINDALQSIETRGFDNLASAITDVITGTKSLGQAFKDVAHSIIAEIIQMTVKMLIFRALSSVFGGLGGGSGLTGAEVAAGARASGGPVSAGMTYLVGEKGPELFKPLSSGTIIPNNRLAANNNGKQVIELRLVTEPSDEAWAKVSHISATQIGQAAPVIVKVASTTTMKALGRRPITGGR